MLLAQAAEAAGPVTEDTWVAQNIFFAIIALGMIVAAVRVVTTRNVVHAALWLVLVLAGAAAQFILLAAEFIAEGVSSTVSPAVRETVSAVERLTGGGRTLEDFRIDLSSLFAEDGETLKPLGVFNAEAFYATEDGDDEGGDDEDGDDENAGADQEEQNDGDAT